MKFLIKITVSPTKRSRRSQVDSSFVSERPHSLHLIVELEEVRAISTISPPQQGHVRGEDFSPLIKSFPRSK